MLIVLIITNMIAKEYYIIKMVKKSMMDILKEENAMV